MSLIMARPPYSVLLCCRCSCLTYGRAEFVCIPVVLVLGTFVVVVVVNVIVDVVVGLFL